MKRFLMTAAVFGLAAGIGLSAGAQDFAQLAAAAGLSPAEAQGMSLTEIAAVKFNHDSDRDDQQTVGANREPVQVDPARHGQLIAAAGLTADEARGLTLTELAAGKYYAEVRNDDRVVYVSSRDAARDVPVQLIAAAGLTPDEARGMSLNDLYVRKINRESDRDDRQGAGF